MTPSRRVALGSTNPVKRAATEAALDELSITEIITVSVDSGVPEQPRGHAQTRTGAHQRAVKAYERADVDLGIGIEGGVGSFPDIDGEFVIMWAAVSDEAREVAASGPAIPLPETVIERLDRGETLGAVVLDEVGPARAAQGAAGVWTDALLNREQALEIAVRTAVGRFQHINNRG